MKNFSILLILLFGFTWYQSVAQTEATETPEDAFALALERASSGVSNNAEWQSWYPDGFEWEFNDVTMVLVPAGCFTMGNDPEAYTYNGTVILEQGVSDGGEQCFDDPFWIDKYEVSQAQLATFEIDHENGFEGDDLPVESITWIQSRDFCRLRDAELPTEAQWAYAARGIDNLIYPWGNDFDGSHVNYCDSNCIGSSWRDRSVDDGYEYTAPVTAFESGTSWVGAYQMSGNVWEWVLSEYASYPYDADDGREQDSDDTEIRHGARGGSWHSGIVFTRTTNRDVDPPDLAGDGIGLRCALVLESTTE